MTRSLEVLHSISDVSAKVWNAMAGEHNPFITHEFLRLLEDSGSVGEATGWLPAHIIVRDESKIVGAMPLYLKDDSYGEYIFDWGWADASHRAGIPYYPKLVSSVPFTPATGPRVLCQEDFPKADLLETLKEALPEVARELKASGVHILFCLEDEARALDAPSTGTLFRRGTHQFHFRNPGYPDFNAFLASLRSKARKQIRKERKRVRESEVELTFHQGDAASDEEWSKMEQLYRSTANKKWGRAYLTSAFFELAKEYVGPSAFLGFARLQGEIVGGALSFEKGRHLYGRYWGCLEDLDFVHFELCYYALIERAIERGYSLVEAGAQGAHKIKRGFLPVVTHSVHHLAHPGLHEAVERAMRQEAAGLAQEIESIQRDGPFREDALPDFRPSAGIDLESHRTSDESPPRDDT